MTELFPSNAVIRRVSDEPALFLGAGRALLLQLAHPAVAQGVDDHSDFKRNPFKRLQGTLEAMNGAVYGSAELAEGIGRRVRWIHEFVSGPAYAANDPANLLWVHATLVDTALWCYETVLEPLGDVEREAYYQDMARVAELFGCDRADQPATYADFRAYFDATVASLEVTDVARDLGGFIVDPELPLRLHVPLGPALRLNRRLTIGTLPPAIREQFGFEWHAGEQQRFDRTLGRIRTIYRATPRPLRLAATRLNGMQLLYFARRHVREFDERMSSREASTTAASSSSFS